jgi:hypothetical protein
MNYWLIKNINGEYYKDHFVNKEYFLNKTNNLYIKCMSIKAIPVTKEDAWVFKDEICAATVACLLGLDWEVEICFRAVHNSED